MEKDGRKGKTPNPLAVMEVEVSRAPYHFIRQTGMGQKSRSLINYATGNEKKFDCFKSLHGEDYMVIMFVNFV